MTHTDSLKKLCLSLKTSNAGFALAAVQHRPNLETKNELRKCGTDIQSLQ
jgi:hypothetical protein